jgi:HD-like signal output (HDOD) protein
MEAFWRRSLNTAVVARVLAAFRREKEIERNFIVGLLHDIGSLLLYLQQPESQAQAIVAHHAEKIPLWQAEQRIFGFDHAEVGGALLKKWNLPPLLCQAVRFHLYPEQAPEKDRQPAWLVHLAWQIVRYHIERDGLLEDDAEIDASIWEANDLSADLLPQILEKAEQQFLASRDIILK